MSVIGICLSFLKVLTIKKYRRNISRSFVIANKSLKLIKAHLRFFYIFHVFVFEICLFQLIWVNAILIGSAGRTILPGFREYWEKTGKEKGFFARSFLCAPRHKKTVLLVLPVPQPLLCLCASLPGFWEYWEYWEYWENTGKEKVHRKFISLRTPAQKKQYSQYS